MPHVSAELRRFVERRAGERCEYCRAPQLLASAPFHVEHIDPRSRGGRDDPDNLALGCGTRNFATGPRIAIPTADGTALIPLFNPRQHAWDEHCAWAGDGITLTGRAAIGVATIAALNMNRCRQLRARPLWRQRGLFP